MPRQERIRFRTATSALILGFAFLLISTPTGCCRGRPFGAEAHLERSSRSRGGLGLSDSDPAGATGGQGPTRRC